jgi:para-aminobenzoate synthetase component 1
MQGLPGGWFGLYDTIIGFEHARKRAWTLAADRPGSSAKARIESLATVLAALPSQTKQNYSTPLDWRTETSRAEHAEGLTRLHAYIRAGDVYQANFTTRFLASRNEMFSPSAFYLALRARSPAPFASYVACGDGVVIAGASPERFLRLDADGRVETRPIKGTAPRQKNKMADRRAAEALRASVKERAENLMIVDLMRNDLGQVCEFGSVAVPELFSVESFAQTHHLVSSVTGQLRVELSAEDLLRATFPGGSITGAPKRRAMEIIDELEAGPRGAYCGMVGWIGFDGAMDSSIIIRTLVVTQTELFAQAGGGITWDSDTASEYDEMMLKLSPLLARQG